MLPDQINQFRANYHRLWHPAISTQIGGYARVGHSQALFRVSETGARVPNNQVAYIHARRENGPRWDPR